MLKAKLDALAVEKAVLGGAVLGGGGGGQLEAGLRLGQQAAERGDSALIDIDSLPTHANLVIITTFHTSAIDTYNILPDDGHRALELLQDNCEEEITGLVNGGNGAVDTLIGWDLASSSHIPLVDVGVMPHFHPESICNLLECWSTQTDILTLTVVGKQRDGNEQIETTYQGTAQELRKFLNQITTQFNGSFAVVIGPVPKIWLASHGKSAFVSSALAVGRAMVELEERGGQPIAAAVSRILNGQLIAFGSVTGIKWHRQGPEAYGLLHLRDEDNRLFTLKLQHRYSNLTVDGKQVAAFPDLIVTLGTKGTPLAGEEVSKGQEIYIITV